MYAQLDSAQRGVPAPLPKLQYSREESAAVIGVSLRTTDRLIAEKQLKVHRIGRRVLIRHDDLMQFIKCDHSTIGRDDRPDTDRDYNS